jgi:hypothetical protein
MYRIVREITKKNVKKDCRALPSWHLSGLLVEVLH